MLGRYQVDNACLALAAIECLGAGGITVDRNAVRSGLEQTRWQGRLERVSQRPDIYLDGAHNPASVKKLVATIREMKSDYRRLILVIGILGDKDYQRIIQEIVPFAEHVVATKPQYSRAIDVDVLTAKIRELHSSVDGADTVPEAIARAREISSVNDLILVTGSLYVVGEARALYFSDSGRAGALSGLK
jgi:dihydrofolate synthase/folylpolyglutamate synthase